MILNKTKFIGDTDISVIVCQKDLVASVIRSINKSYLPASRGEAVLDFIFDLIDEYGSNNTDDIYSKVAEAILRNRVKNKRFVCCNCGELNWEDYDIISFLSNLDIVCPNCNSSEVKTL